MRRLDISSRRVRIAALLGFAAASIPLGLAPAQAATEVADDVAFTCDFSGNAFAHAAEVSVTGSAQGGTITLDAEMGPLNLAPTPMPGFVSFDGPLEVVLHLDVGGTAVELEGSRPAQGNGNSSLEMPALSGTLTGAGTSVAVEVLGVDFALDGTPFTCEADPVVDLGTLDLTPQESLEGVPAEGQVTFSCTMPELTVPRTFPYVADVKVEGIRTDGTGPTVTLVASLGDLPGTDEDGEPLVPVFINAPNAPFTSTVKLKVGGQDATLTGTGTTAVKGGEPIKVPDAQATITTSANQLAIEVLSFDFVAQGMPGNCTAQSGADLGDLTVDRTGKAVPPPGPSPSPSPDAPGGGNGKDKNKGKNKGTPATGTTTFKCVLGPFGSEFDYVADISISGMRAEEGDSTVSLAGDFSKLPGIAPVPIDNGKMEIKTTMKIGGQDVELTGSSTVNAAIKAEVAVPRLTGSVDTDENDLTVEMTAFSFDFGEMAGAHIKAECEAGDGAKLSNLKVGVGDLDDSASGSDSGGSTGATGATTLPKTGGADSIPVIALWAAALAMLGAAALMLTGRARDNVS